MIRKRIHIQGAEVEEDVGLKPLTVSVTAGLLHEQLDSAVDPIG